MFSDSTTVLAGVNAIMKKIKSENKNEKGKE